jgi:four helix bundle protein
MRHHFKNLKVWQMGMDLVVMVYSIVKDYPKEERYDLVSQITRSAISVPSNIAEGSGRNTDKDFAKYLSQSLGSLYELETQIITSYRLNYMSEEKSEEVIKVINELEKMLIGFIRKINPIEEHLKSNI